MCAAVAAGVGHDGDDSRSWLKGPKGTHHAGVAALQGSDGALRGHHVEIQRAALPANIQGKAGRASGGRRAGNDITQAAAAIGEVARGQRGSQARDARGRRHLPDMYAAVAAGIRHTDAHIGDKLASIDGTRRCGAGAIQGADAA